MKIQSSISLVNDMSSLRIAWLSANFFGLELLKEAQKIDGVIIVGIITLKSQSKTIMYDGVKLKKWHQFGIPVYEIENINEEEILIQKLNLDSIIVCGWRQIINEKILSLPKMGFIGFHPSLLPKGRGPAPIINSILENLTESGLTMYYLTSGLDDGDIIGQDQFIITKNDFAQDLYKKIIISGKRLVKKYIPLLIIGKAPRIPQNNSEATYFPKRTIKDNEFNPQTDSSLTIYNKIRAFSKPYKGAFFRKSNQKVIIWNAELEDL